MKPWARSAIACALLLTSVSSFAIQPPQEFRFSVDELNGSESFHARSGLAATASSSEGSFASGLALKQPTRISSIEGWATGGPYQRSPVFMSQAAPVPRLLDMTPPVSSGGSINIDGPRVSPIPEPSTYALLVAGLAAVGFVVRKRTSR